MCLSKKDFDDIVTEEDSRQWSQLCAGHAEQVDEEDAGLGHVDSIGSGICGVEGCEAGAEHYIDFKV